MTTESPQDGERPGIEKAERDPVGFETAWLSATEDKPGEQTWDSAMAVVSGEDPDQVGDPDEPVVNGYKGGDRNVETPRRQEGGAELPAPPRPGY